MQSSASSTDGDTILKALPTGVGVKGRENEKQDGPTDGIDAVENGSPTASSKSISFYMSVASLAIMVLITSMDATSLNVAIPVRNIPLFFFLFTFFRFVRGSVAQDIDCVRGLPHFCIWLTAGCDLDSYERSWRHHLRGILGEYLVHACRGGDAAHLYQHLGCPGAQDTAIRLDPPLLDRVRRVRRRPEHARRDTGPGVAGPRRRRPRRPPGDHSRRYHQLEAAPALLGPPRGPHGHRYHPRPHRVCPTQRIRHLAVDRLGQPPCFRDRLRARRFLPPAEAYRSLVPHQARTPGLVRNAALRHRQHRRRPASELGGRYVPLVIVADDNAFCDWSSYSRGFWFLRVAARRARLPIPHL